MNVKAPSESWTGHLLNTSQKLCRSSHLSGYLEVKWSVSLYVWVCMYVCMYIRVCMYVYMYECVCMYVYMHVCTYILCMYVYMYVCIYVCIYIYVCMYACVYVCKCVCMYVCMYVFIASWWSTSTAQCNSRIKQSCVGLNLISVCFEYLTQWAESIVTTLAGWGCQVATCARGLISHYDFCGYRANKLHLRTVGRPNPFGENSSIHRERGRTEEDIIVYKINLTNQGTWWQMHCKKTVRLRINRHTEEFTKSCWR